MPSQTLPPSTGPSLLDILKNLYGTNTNAPSTPTAADLAYINAQQNADGSAGSAISNGASSVGSAINSGLNSLFNLPQQQDPSSTAPDLSSTTGSGAPMGYGGAGGQATDVIPPGILAAIQKAQAAPQPTADQLNGVVGPTSSTAPQGPVDTPIAPATGTPDVNLDANGNPVDPNATGNLANTDREANPFQNQLGLFNQQAAQLSQNPNPQAAQGLLGSLGDTLSGYAAKLKALSPSASQGLITAGLGILGGNDGRHSLTQLVGQGGAAGVGAYTAAQQRQLLNTQAAQKIATENAKFALDVQKAGSEAGARTDNTAARQAELKIQQQNADTAKQKANAEMSGTSKWVTVPDGNGGYVQQGYDKNGNATSKIPASADDIAKLSATKAPTDGQSKASGYANRMIQNEGVIQDHATSNLGASGFYNRVAPNVLASSGYQQYTAAKNNWIAALLRQESGAAISEGEYKAAEQQYFPTSGDSTETIQQKQALRATAAQSMIGAAGPNYKPIVNSPQGSQAAPQATAAQQNDYMSQRAIVTKAAAAGNKAAIAAARSAGWTY